ncbi:MAG: DNA polymerase III subunit alpha [Gemmatimonadetes bacterium 13_1_40CM_3_69_22]|nr:MAG: DNA polymerase III subunit alpha [Gemmatimonadetes bacterium 13_1_40CM_3_69_22]PYO15936.1 MAG: DNA polymerase III subunit alpha [Gemmatimonadota bacterium]
MPFVHLHTHSEYSLLDGANRIPDLLDRIRTLGMDSLAITDHGNLHGAWQFYSEAKSRGVRPILGFEAYLAFGSRHKRERPVDAPAAYSHLVLLAKNRTGYRNLIKLSSIGFLEGYYRRPRIDREALEQHKEGLIGLAACLSGEIALYLRQGNEEAAKASARYFAQLFGKDGFWLEVQDHGLAEEKVVSAGMFRLGQELGLPVLATNDAHYLKKDDAEAHDVLLAIGTGKDLDDPNRFRFFGQESYVKSEAEMRPLFSEHPQVLAETARVAELCEFDFEKRYFLPQYPRPAEFASDNDLLVHLARAGARERYGDPLPAAVEQRLAYELDVIQRTGYAGYFLIVYDLIKAARDRGIPTGPGRGSSAGSLVAYALGITAVDPLKFDLLFERFLNPERVSMPDIDLDFCFERRSEVIEYVRARYGRESVGQIITFGTLKARAAFRDVARTLRVEMGDVDRITKLIPSGPAFALTLAEAAEKVPEVKAAAAQDERIRKVLNLGARIEGLARHASVHAAGLVIAPGPLADYVPVCIAPQDTDAIITQYDMVSLEQAGMLKIDLLGLKTLTVIHDAVQMIQERHGVAVDPATLDLEDAAVYELLRSGRTAGVFQFESPLATDCLRNMKCDRFDDLVATNALMRPGPLDSGMHLVFIRRKRGDEPVRYPHAALRDVLEPTYGVIVYQEQVMRIANVLAGYSLAEADVLRKAVGKKDKELLQRELGPFVERAVARGHDRRTVEDIAAQIATFGRYGFPKAHSVAYSILSFQTAWLKAHYAPEFMSALLSSEIGNTDKVVQYINEARELGLEVLPPDVNESGFKFTVVGDRRIRFGLGAIKNVGGGAIESIIAGRRAGGPYRSLVDLSDRIDLRLCNKRVIEALIDSGACDSLGGHRAQLVAALDHAFAEAQARQAERDSGQHPLFGGETPTPDPRAPLPDVPPWSEHDRLAREKAVLGFFISGHPLAKYRAEVELFGSRTTATLSRWSDQRVRIAAVVTVVKRQISKKTGAEYARLVLEDFHGTAEALVFPEAWAKLNDLIRPDQALLLTGGHSARDRDEEQAPFIVEGAQSLEQLRANGAIGVALVWSRGAPPPPDAARAVAAVCAAHPGPCPVLLEWADGAANDTGAGNGGRNPGDTARLRSRSLRVEVADDLLGALRGLLGTDHVHLVRTT